jgi:hypothetical protein
VCTAHVLMRRCCHLNKSLVCLQSERRTSYENICVTNDYGYVPPDVNTSRSFPHSWFITGFVTRLTRRIPLVEQEPLTLQGHLGSTPVYSGVRITRSLVLCVCFVDRCLSFRTFSFGHCDVCSSSTYEFWLPLWYLQAPLSNTCLTICWRDAMTNNLLLYIQTGKGFLHCQIKLIIKYVDLIKLFFIW